MVLKMKIENHILLEARYLESPNCDERKTINDLSLIVIHSISLPPGEFGGPGIDALFTNTIDPKEHPYYELIANLRVSAHVLIRRDGDIVQYVPFNKRAWHAGVSNYKGRETCNDFSIGIELEGTDDSIFEDIQYQTLNDLISSLITHYPSLSYEDITGHEEIAPGRKTDPGPFFEWSRIIDPR